jgi:tetratricopeptide (TPR) repeat protein
LPSSVGVELSSVGPARVVARLEARLADAARAYERERYDDARLILRDVVRLAPAVVAVRELNGLCLYQLGRWKEAIKELTLVHELSGSVDQYPVLADCERALGHHDRVAELWGELRQAGAGSDVLAEGRIVMAGSLADRARYKDAIALLEPTVARPVRKPLERHLRQWFTLADLYDKSGDVPKARELFRRILEADAEMPGVAERLSSLGDRSGRR